MLFFILRLASASMNAYECVDARSSHAPLTGGGLADNSRIVGYPELG